MADGDAVVMFNFRGDRAIEISRAFDDDDVRQVRPRAPARRALRRDDGVRRRSPHPEALPGHAARDRAPDGRAPRRAPHVSQLAICETQKYGHVTYFWNGNRSGMFDDGTETYIEIPSDRVPFEQRPWMKAAEITDRLIAELRTGRHRFARVNYANGDMVGHTGAFDATVLAVEAVDLQLARLAQGRRRTPGNPGGYRRPRQRRRDVPARQERARSCATSQRPARGKDQPHAEPRAILDPRPDAWRPLRDRSRPGRGRPGSPT